MPLPSSGKCQQRRLESFWEPRFASESAADPEGPRPVGHPLLKGLTLGKIPSSRARALVSQRGKTPTRIQEAIEIENRCIMETGGHKPTRGERGCPGQEPMRRAPPTSCQAQGSTLPLTFTHTRVCWVVRKSPVQTKHLKRGAEEPRRGWSLLAPAVGFPGET